MLRATTACTFSTSQLPKVVRDRQFLTLLTWKCASRHNGVRLFRHRNFQKWSDAEVFCTFWLGNVLRATTSCTFSTSQRPKVVREWCVLYILTWKCASRHNGVQFFISHLASWLRTRRFSEPTFRSSGATNHWKNHSESRLSYLFAHLYLLSSHSFSSTLLSSNLSLLSASSLLCFSSVHIVGSLTSKLPSIIYSMYIYNIQYVYIYILKNPRHWDVLSLVCNARPPKRTGNLFMKSNVWQETRSGFVQKWGLSHGTYSGKAMCLAGNITVFAHESHVFSS